MRRRRTHALLAFLLGLAFVGCNAILGNDAWKLPPETEATDAGGLPADATGNADAPRTASWDGRASDAAACDPATCLGICTRTGCLATLAKSSSFPTPIALDDTNVYWGQLSGDYGLALTVPKAGGAVTTLGSDVIGVNRLTAKAGNLFFSGYYGGSLSKVLVDGGTGMSLLKLTPDHHVLGIAVSETAVYFTISGSSVGEVASISTGGGNQVPIASALDGPCAITVDAKNIYWSTIGNGGKAEGLIMSASLDGGSRATLASAQNSPNGIAVDAQYVYWVNNAGSVWRAPIGGDEAPTRIAENRFDQKGDCFRSGGIAVDNAHIYWTNVLERTVMRANLDGSNPTTLWSASNAKGAGGRPADVAVDNTSVYWTDMENGIRKLTPK